MSGSATKDVEKLRLGDAVYFWRDGQLRDTRGNDVPLRAKSLKMFSALLSERGRVLSKDRLSEVVWPETVATDESIARCIADIRKALNDEQYEIVQTYPKMGYRLNVSSVEVDPQGGRTLGAIPFYGILGVIAVLDAQVRAHIKGRRSRGSEPWQIAELGGQDARREADLKTRQEQPRCQLDAQPGLERDVGDRLTLESKPTTQRQQLETLTAQTHHRMRFADARVIEAQRRQIRATDEFAGRHHMVDLLLVDLEDRHRARHVISCHKQLPSLYNTHPIGP